MDVWSNTNMINYVGWLLANTLKVPASKLNIHPMYVGGSFGSKHILGKVIGIAGMLAKRSGRPVKFMEDRVDNLLASENLACDRFYDAELAVTSDGIFKSIRVRVVDDYGAYFQFGHGTHGNALAQVTGPYRMASFEYGVRCVLTNKCQQGVFRGAGSDAGNFCLERLVDAAAQELSIDPVEIRRRNFIAPASFPFKTPCGNVYDSGNYPAVLDRALEMAGYAELRRMQAEARTAGRYIGIGLATAQQRSVYGPTEFWFWYDSPGLTTAPESVGLSLGPTGEFIATMFSPFWGNSPETVVAQTLAEEFGIEPSQVTVTYEDSQHALPSAGPGGSRMTVMLTGAVVGAARKLKDKLARIAAHQLEAAVEDIAFADGRAMVRGAPDKAMTYAELGLKAYWFKLDLPPGMESGLEARHTYDHPYLTKPSADRKDLGAFYPDHGPRRPHPRRRGRAPDRARALPALRRRPRRGHHRQSEEPPRPDHRRHRPGHRHGPVRAERLRRRGPAADRQLHGLPPAHRARGAGLRDRPRGDAVALHRVRRQGRRRRRPHDRARGHRRRGGGRAGPPRRARRRGAADARAHRQPGGGGPARGALTRDGSRDGSRSTRARLHLAERLRPC